MELPHAVMPASAISVRRSGQRVVGVRVEPLGHRVHLLAPGPEGAALALGAAAQRSVEGVAVAVGEPGDVKPRHRDRAAAGRVRVTAMKPAVLDLDQHVVVDAAPSSQARSSNTPSRGRSRGQPLEHVGERVDTGQAVVHLGVLVGRVRDPGRVADEQHRGRDAGGGEDAGVVAGPGRDDRPPPRGRASRAARSRVEVDRRDTDSAVTSQRRAVAVGALVACRSIAATSASSAASAAAGVQPGGDGDGHGVGAVGLDVDPAERRPRPASRACLLAASAVIA